ncbi:hypothetical protein NF700_12790 [Sphingomonadaceae bacterium OTU29MARTA1]|nr:hypothetical protein NF700_12790 [Sphingomonadaceae bacterium OTU29MARTA1]
MARTAFEQLTRTFDQHPQPLGIVGKTEHRSAVADRIGIALRFGEHVRGQRVERAYHGRGEPARICRCVLSMCGYRHCHRRERDRTGAGQQRAAQPRATD